MHGTQFENTNANCICYPNSHFVFTDTLISLLGSIAMSTLRFQKPSERDICDETPEVRWSVSRSLKRRWRMAFTAISFIRLLFALSKKVLDKDGSLLCTLSFVAIDMQLINDDSPLDNNAVTLLSIDPTKLREMVRDKNFESLSDFGGVQELALILETDVKNG